MVACAKVYRSLKSGLSIGCCVLVNIHKSNNELQDKEGLSPCNTCGTAPGRALAPETTIPLVVHAAAVHAGLFGVREGTCHPKLLRWQCARGGCLEAVSKTFDIGDDAYNMRSAYHDARY
eukprot:1137841-Pelagomonas_calceolata.AAC.8